ncbi:MAG TPA: PDZ domain-containing protein [Fimbriiglobus sp.]|jgi:hypothetical protein|nr:PDZ domain-containing protein [Fimbriiglobus sp.]
MRTATTFFAAIALFAAAAPCPAQAPKADPKPVVVPFKLLPSRHMLLDVTLNGKGPYKLIFDTGAPLNLVNSRVGKDAGLLKKKKAGGGFGFGLFGGVSQVEVDKLQVGDVTAVDLPAVVMDHPTVNAISSAFEDEFGKIEGIVGFPFFARYATTVDYQKQELVLKPTDYKPADYLGDLMTRLMSASEKGGKPRVVGAAGLWGFSVQPADDKEPGVLVKEVFQDGPAAAAGLKPGDRMLTLDGRWTDSVGDAYMAASLVRPGRTVAVVVKRDGKDITLKVTPTKGY